LFVGESGSIHKDLLNNGTLFARGGKGDFRDSFPDAILLFKMHRASIGNIGTNFDD
jgi:hypothetical protein